MIIMDFCTIVKNLNLSLYHNVAFQEGFLGLSRTTMGNSASIPLDDLCEHFIVNHKDIAQKLKSIDLDKVKAYLSGRQFNELNE